MRSPSWRPQRCLLQILTLGSLERRNGVIYKQRSVLSKLDEISFATFNRASKQWRKLWEKWRLVLEYLESCFILWSLSRLEGPKRNDNSIWKFNKVYSTFCLKFHWKVRHTKIFSLSLPLDLPSSCSVVCLLSIQLFSLLRCWIKNFLSHGSS
jgi:hypothetical protein